MSENIIEKCCCGEKANGAISNPTEQSTAKSAACCSVRESVQSVPRNRFLAFWSSISGQLVLGILSGISLFASLFFASAFPYNPAWVAIVLSGTPLFWGAITALRERRITAEVLVSTAILATIYTGEIFAGGEVAFIMMLGHLLENWTIRRARAGIERLLRLTPQIARRIDAEGKETVVEAALIRCGEQLKVLPGESVPVDGRILSGNTSIDQQLLTGEPLPVDKEPGEEVFAGTLNRFGAFTMEATNVGEDSTLARMIRLVREAESKKAPMERITDRWASILVPAAIATAILVGLLTQDLMRAVTILVVFCPCSLVLATPTAIIAAIGNASRFGILIRSGEILERLGRITSIAFDKTGTLTWGKPELRVARSVSGSRTDDSLLALAASLECSSGHPLSRCVVDAAVRRTIEFDAARCENVQVIPGRGISGDWKETCCATRSRRILIGNEKLMQEHGIPLPGEEVKGNGIAEYFDLMKKGDTLVWVAVDSEIAGFLAISDTVRGSARETVRRLRDENIDVHLLTGDHADAAREIARRVGIEHVSAELLPEDKLRIIEEKRRQGKTVAMIGDGINDAPALKTADVGIAMGKMGSDLAIEAADITLVGDDLSRVPFLIRLSRKTVRTILGNITLSMSINFIAVILASIGWINPVIGALVHNAGSLLVVFNASLLLRVNLFRK